MRNETYKPAPLLWTIDDDGIIVPVGHNEPRQKFGDITLDPETDSVYRVVPGRYYRPSWLYLGSMSGMGITP